MQTSWYKCAYHDAGYNDQECTCDVPPEMLQAKSSGDEELAKTFIPSWRYNVGKSVERLAEFEKNWKNADVLREAARILKETQNER